MCKTVHKLVVWGRPANRFNQSKEGRDVIILTIVCGYTHINNLSIRQINVIEMDILPPVILITGVELSKRRTVRRPKVGYPLLFNQYEWALSNVGKHSLCQIGKHSNRVEALDLIVRSWSVSIKLTKFISVCLDWIQNCYILF